MIKMNDIFEYLDELFPNPKCELEYKKDYELLISVMLSAQSTDKRVNKVTSVLYKKYPSLEALGNAPIDDIKSIIRSVGSYNKKAEAVLDIANKLKQYAKVPNDRLFLESLKGVGRKTTNVVLSELYKEPFIAVDTHVLRISHRLGISKMTDDVLKTEQLLYKKIPKERYLTCNQQFVLFGRYYCKAINPKCEDCKLKKICKKKD